MKNYLSKYKNLYFLLCLAVLFAMGIFINHIADNSKIPYSLTIVTPKHENITSKLSPFGNGFDRDLMKKFGEFIVNESLATYKPTIKWRTAENIKQAINLINTGQADIAVGFSHEPGKNLPDSSISHPYPYEFGPKIYKTGSLEIILPIITQRKIYDNPDGKKILSNFNPAPLPTVLDLNSWNMWKPFVKDFSANSKQYITKIEPTEIYTWVWNNNNMMLTYALQAFWKYLLQPQNQTLEHLQNRYYSYFPHKVTKYELSRLYNILQNRLPEYTEAIKNATQNTKIDPLLLVAVILQESRFKEDMISFTGVQGIMQLTRQTARYLNVDRLDPVQAISGGARYLNMIWEKFEDKNLEKWDRWHFTLAAFNQGTRRLNGAIALSQKLGGTGKTWLELKKVLPLLSQEKYASMVGQNTGRGGEAVRFVKRVRWYYHILQGLVILGHPEAQNLTPLLAVPPKLSF